MIRQIPASPTTISRLPYNLRIDFRRKVADRIAAAIALRTGAEWERIFAEADVPCAMARSFDEWRAWDEAQKAGLAENVPGCDYVQLGRRGARAKRRTLSSASSGCERGRR